MNLTIYRPEDEQMLGLLDKRDATAPGSLDRADADAAIARYLGTVPVQQRVDLVCSVMAGLEAQREGADVQLMRLRDSKARIEDAIAAIRYHLAVEMASLGTKRLAGTAENLVLRDNPEAVHISDLSLVPDEYLTVRVKMSVEQWKDLQGLALETGNDRLLDGISTDAPAPIKGLIKGVIKGGGGVPGAFIDQGVSIVRT